ncbi:MAG TPA: hypothetical protein VKZ53_12890 [Candidatus Angelobacter sp.]|nr:hypothetical protein [Candidatus Angelobacter sp.]
MRFLAVFAAGVLLGKNWDKVMRTLAPVVRTAADQFEATYARTTRNLGQHLEDMEDRIAERRHVNGQAAVQVTD